MTSSDYLARKGLDSVSPAVLRSWACLVLSAPNCYSLEAQQAAESVVGTYRVTVDPGNPFSRTEGTRESITRAILEDAPMGARRHGDWCVPIGPPALDASGRPTVYAR